jgi:VanZ family protein
MRWRWLLVAGGAILATTPFALPLWNGWLAPRLGAFLTIEQVHLLEFGLLGVVGGLAGRGSRRSVAGQVAAAVAAIGLADELLQALMPGRYFAWSDVGLNALGGLLGLVLARALRSVG